MESRHFGSGDQRYEAIQPGLKAAYAILATGPNDPVALAELSEYERECPITGRLTRGDCFDVRRIGE
jgi:hypothetical protein